MKVNKNTRANGDGKSIKCPHCGYTTKVYHFNWSAITCGGCKQLIDKYDWDLVDTSETKTFPNGFDNWHETHFEVVTEINLQIIENRPCKRIYETLEKIGHGGLYELAKELTDKFEEQNKGVEWDGDWFDAIQDFLSEELS